MFQPPYPWLQANRHLLGREFTTAQVIAAMPPGTVNSVRSKILEQTVARFLRRLGATKQRRRVPPHGRRAYVWVLP